LQKQNKKEKKKYARGKGETVWGKGTGKDCTTCNDLKKDVQTTVGGGVDQQREISEHTENDRRQLGLGRGGMPRNCRVMWTESSDGGAVETDKAEQNRY